MELFPASLTATIPSSYTTPFRSRLSSLPLAHRPDPRRRSTSRRCRRRRARRASSTRRATSAPWSATSTAPSSMAAFSATPPTRRTRSYPPPRRAPATSTRNEYPPSKPLSPDAISEYGLVTAQDGKLRLLYEAAPMGFLMEQAGGLALTGDQATSTYSASPLCPSLRLFFSHMLFACSKM